MEAKRQFEDILLISFSFFLFFSFLQFYNFIAQPKAEVIQTEWKGNVLFHYYISKSVKCSALHESVLWWWNLELDIYVQSITTLKTLDTFTKPTKYMNIHLYTHFIVWCLYMYIHLDSQFLYLSCALSTLGYGVTAKFIRSRKWHYIFFEECMHTTQYSWCLIIWDITLNLYYKDH